MDVAVNVAAQVRSALLSVARAADTADATTDTPPLSLDEELEQVVSDSFVELQKLSHNSVAELYGNIAAQANPVSVAYYQRMLTTAKRGGRIPACVYGAQCQSKQIVLTVDGNPVAPADIPPFRVWLAPDEEGVILSGGRVPNLNRRPCAACYIAELTGRLCVRQGEHGAVLDPGLKATLFPAFVALTCEGPTSAAIAAAVARPGTDQPTDLAQPLHAALADVAFGMAHVVGYRLLGRPSPLALPRFSPRTLRWIVLSRGEGEEEPQLVLQADCSHMCVPGPPSRLLLCARRAMLTPGFPPSRSQESARALWRASVNSVDWTCGDCHAYRTAYPGRPEPVVANVYVACFAGMAEEDVVWATDLAPTITGALSLLAGRTGHLPKNFAQKLANLLSWVVRDPRTMETIQPILFTARKKEEAARWRVPPNPAPLPQIGAAAPVCEFSYRGARERMPQAMAELVAKVPLLRALRVAIAYVAWRDAAPPDDWLDPRLVYESGLLEEVGRVLAHPPGTGAVAHGLPGTGAVAHGLPGTGAVAHGPACCQRHCACRLTPAQLFYRIGTECCEGFILRAPPCEDEADAAGGLLVEIGLPEVPDMFSCLQWVFEQGAATAKHGRIVMARGPGQLQTCHARRLRVVAPVTLYVCPQCGESNMTRAAMQTKTDRRNKVIGYDLSRWCYTCRSTPDDPPSVPLPSHGCYLRVFGVWWCLCCMCLQPVMANRCFTHWSATNVCTRCTTQANGGRVVFKSVLH